MGLDTMHRMSCAYRVLLLFFAIRASASTRPVGQREEEEHTLLQRKLHLAKMELWSRGEFLFNNNDLGVSPIIGDEKHQLHKRVDTMEQRVYQLDRQKPIKRARRDTLLQHKNHCMDFNCLGGIEKSQDWLEPMMSMRGGETTTADNNSRLEAKLAQLEKRFGSEFRDAIELNKRQHAADCLASCQHFYCASSTETSRDNTSNDHNNTSFASYGFGATPPEDFAQDFGFPLDLIKISKGDPLFSAQEAEKVIAMAAEEGVHLNEYPSGKYKVGGDWLVNLNNTRDWFNHQLKSTLFPLVASLFPVVVSSPSVLRAHSVSLLKYNATHPRTDVHIDNGILAMTIAMSPQSQYKGGGTYFEHMGPDNIIQMDVGHATFRPGSVRHGGHAVTGGTRYVLGAFLLIQDRVEHVRRLKNRGSALRRAGDLEGAAKHFEWALAINPRCTTCLKDFAEVLLANKQFKAAEEKTRKALEYLEGRDSDALFTLGLILSEQGRDDESIEAYRKSVELNAHDAELCYNLGIKLGSKGDIQSEMDMYARATSIDPEMGGAWINWGTSLAESGNLDDAEKKFLEAIKCPEVAPKAHMNLALVYQSKAKTLASQGDLEGAKDAAIKAGKHLDSAKSMLDSALASGEKEDEFVQYEAQFEPLRLSFHRLTGSILSGLQDYEACEDEFQTATKSFPHVPGLWEMLARVLDLQGKTKKAAKAREHMQVI